MQKIDVIEEIQERGFSIVENLLTAAECAEVRERLDAYWRAQGSPPFGGWGFPIHPLAQKVPELRRFLVHPVIFETLDEAFGAPTRILHAGARMSDEHSSQTIDWHNHYSWDASHLTQRTRCERLLCGLYIDGSTAESGPLTAIPRRFDEPIGSVPLENDPREVPVEAPPGSLVIFDTALWHRARRGNRPGVRHLIGGHYQPVHDTRSHPEDNDVTPR